MLNEQPAYGSTVSYTIAEGTFCDIFGNVNNEFTAEEEYYYSYGYTLADILGSYEVNATSYWYGPTTTTLTIAAYTPAEETPKTGTVSHVVQNPYQKTDNYKGNFNFRAPGKIIINDGVKLTDEHKQIIAELSKLGISGTVSSGIREGAKTAQGKTSFHAVGQAFDFVPSAKYTSEQFKELLLTSGAYDYVKSLGYNILDETTPEIMKKTGATGPHFHFGKDPIKAKNGVKFIKPISYFEQFSNYNDYTLPELSEPIKKLFGKNSNNVREIIVGLKDAG
jgi:hypothetical protein